MAVNIDSVPDCPEAPGACPARIHLSKADVTEVEQAHVIAALRSGWVAPAGPDLEAFEMAIADRIGVRHAVGLSSGTAALHLALLAIGARAGSVVLCPSLTFAASANAIAYTGAEPVFVDARSDDGNVDGQLLLDAVDTLQQEGAEVAAVLTVDLFGRCCDYSIVGPALAERGVPLIEDAAEALGSRYEGRPAGSFGDAAALSFNGNKILTTSGGGMLLSDSSELIERARYLSTQARQPVPWYEHTEIGYNYRLSNILAALGRAQLSRLDSMVSRRRQIRQMYEDGLSEFEGIRFLGSDARGSKHADNCWLSVMIIDTKITNQSPDLLISELDNVGIEARHVWKPMHLQPSFKGARSFITGAAAKLFASGVALPSGSSLTDEEINRVIVGVRRSLEA